MKKVLIISFTDLSSDPRVNRQIRFLKDEYKVIAVGKKSPEIEGVDFIDCGRIVKTWKEKVRDVFKLLGGYYESYYWSANHIKVCLEKLKDINVDVIIANDIDSLPLALKIARNSKVIFDAHEYSPKEFEDLFYWRMLYQKYREYLCARYINQSDAMMTVCEGIANTYKEKYGVEPVIVTNAPYYQELKPKSSDNKEIRIIFHGTANPSRKIENIIRMMDYLDNRFSLDLMLIGQDRYINKLKYMASRNKHIHFISPVPMKDICNVINKYDIGVYILEPNSFNNLMALPNKFFEFIQSRLAVAIGPSPEMARIVKKYDCGVVAEDFKPSSLAACISGLDNKKIDYYKSMSDKLARIMCAENNGENVIQLLNRVL